MSREKFTQNYDTESGAAPSEPRDIADRASNITKTTNTDNSVRKNDWGPWVAIAIGLGGLSFGGLIIFAILLPPLMTSIAKAESAKAENLAASAKQEARIAQDAFTQTQIQLGKKGIEIRIDRH